MTEISVKIKNFKEQASKVEKLFTDNFVKKIIEKIASRITKEEEVYINLKKEERLEWSSIPDVKGAITELCTYLKKKDVNVSFEFEKFNKQKEESQGAYLYSQILENREKIDTDFGIALNYIDSIETFVISNFFKEQYFIIRMPQRKNWIENRLSTKMYLDYLRDCVSNEYSKLDNNEQEEFKQEFIEVTDDFLYTYFID